MGVFVVVLLAAVWALILLPGVYRAHRQVSGIDSFHAFERTMSMLARHCSTPTGPADTWPSGRHVLVLDDAASVAGYRSRARMRRRQRAALAQLGSAASITGALAVLLGGALWTLFGASAAAFAGYALLVAQVRAREAERRRKVRPLRSATRPAPTYHMSPEPEHVRIQRWVG